jgi:hypothetical protein
MWRVVETIEGEVRRGRMVAMGIKSRMQSSRQAMHASGLLLRRPSQTSESYDNLFRSLSTKFCPSTEVLLAVLRI